MSAERHLAKMALVFTLIEIVIFLILAYAAGTSIANALLGHYGEIIIAVATTWYVIFTYGLLATAEQSRRSVAEPYLTVAWNIASTASKHCASAITVLGDLLGHKLHDAGIQVFANRSQGDRFIIITIENQRQIAVGQLSFEVIGTVLPVEPIQMPNISLPSKSVAWNKERVALGYRENIEITVCDIAEIPLGFEIELRVRNLVYTSIDSQTELYSYGGPPSFIVKGSATSQPQQPRPRRFDEGEL